MAIHAIQTFANLFVKVQEARHNRDDEAVKKAVNDYDEVLEK